MSASVTYTAQDTHLRTLFTVTWPTSDAAIRHANDLRTMAHVSEVGVVGDVVDVIVGIMEGRS